LLDSTGRQKSELRQKTNGTVKKKKRERRRKGEVQGQQGEKAKGERKMEVNKNSRENGRVEKE